MSDAKNELDTLDEAFSTLDLVNAPDMDVYLKILMSVDEKTSQNIRGDINHLMTKYIDADPALKEKLIKNDYCQLNLGYLQPVYTDVREVQLNAFHDNICNCISNIIKNSYNILNAFDSIESYVYGLQDLKDFQLTDDTFLATCSKYNHFDNDIKTIHINICKILVLLNHKYNYQSKPIDSVSYRPIVAEIGKLIGISFSFASYIFLRDSRNIYVHIYVYDLSEHTIEQIIKYFNDRKNNNNGMMPYKLEDTLKIISARKNSG